MFINKSKVKFGLGRFVRRYYVIVIYKLGSAMVDATPNEVVSSIALSVILELYEIGGTGIFLDFLNKISLRLLYFSRIPLKF